MRWPIRIQVALLLAALAACSGSQDQSAPAQEVGSTEATRPSAEPSIVNSSRLADQIAAVGSLSDTSRLDPTQLVNRIRPNDKWTPLDEPQSFDADPDPGLPIAEQTSSLEDWCLAVEDGAPTERSRASSEWETTQLGDSWGVLYIDVYRFDSARDAGSFVARRDAQLARCTGIDLLVEPSGASGTFSMQSIDIGGVLAKQTIFANGGSVALRFASDRIVIDLYVNEVTPANQAVAMQELTGVAQIAARETLAEYEELD